MYLALPRLSRRRIYIPLTVHLNKSNLTYMHLTRVRLETVVSEAHHGIDDCHQIIDIHARQKKHKVLNPYLVLSAVSAWERFIVNLLGASEKSAWDPRMNDERSTAAPWPGSRADEDFSQKNDGYHVLDSRLIEANVLDEPLTSYWQALVSTDYRGSDPRKWRLGSFRPEADEKGRRILQQGLLGAKTARDAVAHRIYHRKAEEAESLDDIRKWHYTWSSDNYVKTGNPTIQNGYARGTVALFIQLIDCTAVRIANRQGWARDGIRLPADWFDDRDRWNVDHLHRVD